MVWIKYLATKANCILALEYIVTVHKAPHVKESLRKKSLYKVKIIIHLLLTISPSKFSN